MRDQRKEVKPRVALSTLETNITINLPDNDD
jgi:hypothetical protein